MPFLIVFATFRKAVEMLSCDRAQPEFDVLRKADTALVQCRNIDVEKML